VSVDRVSAFNDAEVIKMLQTRFIPVAVDGGLMFRRKDPEGAFYRKFANTQARYAAAADGTSLARKTWAPSPYLNKWMKDALAKFAALPESARKPAVDAAETVKTTRPLPPRNGLVLTVVSRYLKGHELASEVKYSQLPAYDRVWFTRGEWQALLPKDSEKSYALDAALVHKLVRFHTLDIVGRQRPPWPDASVKQAQLHAEVLPGDGKMTSIRLTGSWLVEGSSKPGPGLGPDDGAVKLDLKVEGVLRFDAAAGRITQLDLVAYGPYLKAGRPAELGFHFYLTPGAEATDNVPPWAVDRHHLYGDYPTYYTR
jgi:hypothetical protein